MSNAAVAVAAVAAAAEKDREINNPAQRKRRFENDKKRDTQQLARIVIMNTNNKMMMFANGKEDVLIVPDNANKLERRYSFHISGTASDEKRRKRDDDSDNIISGTVHSPRLENKQMADALDFNQVKLSSNNNNNNNDDDDDDDDLKYSDRKSQSQNHPSRVGYGPANTDRSDELPYQLENTALLPRCCPLISPDEWCEIIQQRQVC